MEICYTQPWYHDAAYPREVVLDWQAYDNPFTPLTTGAMSTRRHLVTSPAPFRRAGVGLGTAQTRTEAPLFILEQPSSPSSKTDMNIQHLQSGMHSLATGKACTLPPPLWRLGSLRGRPSPLLLATRSSSLDHFRLPFDSQVYK
jgi:hypothetical protein